MVSIKQNFVKPYNYQFGIIVETEINDLEECVAAKVRKSNGKIVKRHVTDLVLLESRNLESSQNSEGHGDLLIMSRKNPKRLAAVTSRSKTNDLYTQSLA